MIMFRRITLFLIVAVLISCGKDVVIIEDPVPPSESDELFEVNLIGFSTDENRVYLSDTQIEIDGKITNSDESGLFHLEKVLVGQKGKIIKVEKDGYLPSVFRMSNHQNLEQIVLNLQMWIAPEKKSIGTSGGSIEDENGALLIPENSTNANSEFLFESFVGKEANNGNMDQLYLSTQTDFLLKEASVYVEGSSPLNPNTQLEVRLEMGQFSSTDITNLALFHFDETDLIWKQKSTPLSIEGDQLTFAIDRYGWWTVAENVLAQRGTLKLTQVNDIQLKSTEVKLSFDNDTYQGSVLYTSSSGTITTFFPSNKSITASLSNDQFEGVYSSGFSSGTNTGEINFAEEIQAPYEGKVYACDFTFSEGYVAILSDGQHKIAEIGDGQFSGEGFVNDNDVKLHFYSDNFDFSNSRISNIESLLSENNSFFSCSNLDDNLVVTDGENLFQDFDNCRVKVRPKETFVIGESSDGDVFLVSFEGKKKGVYDGLFYHDVILNDVKSEVVINIILYDEVDNKLGGFIKTEYISTGEELSISFIGNIE